MHTLPVTTTNQKMTGRRYKFVYVQRDMEPMRYRIGTL